MRWLGRLPGLLLIATWPLYVLALLTDDFKLYVGLGFVAGITVGAAFPALFTAPHRIRGSPRRTMAVAITLFFANLLGLGFGPFITGLLSDLFTASYGPAGLRYALVVAVSFLLPTGVTLIFMARSIERDSEA